MKEPAWPLAVTILPPAMPFFKARFKAVLDILLSSTLKFERMYFLMAILEDPLLSARATIALATISPKGG